MNRRICSGCSAFSAGKYKICYIDKKESRPTNRCRKGNSIIINRFELEGRNGWERIRKQYPDIKKFDEVFDLLIKEYQEEKQKDVQTSNKREV